MNNLKNTETATVENLSAIFTQTIKTTDGLTSILKNLLLEQLSNESFCERLSKGLEKTVIGLSDISENGELLYDSKELKAHITGLATAIRRVFSRAKINFVDDKNMIGTFATPMKLSFNYTKVEMIIDKEKLTLLKGKIAMAKVAEIENAEKIAEKERIASMPENEKIAEKERIARENKEIGEKIKKEREIENDRLLSELIEKNYISIRRENEKIEKENADLRKAMAKFLIVMLPAISDRLCLSLTEKTLKGTKEKIMELDNEIDNFTKYLETI
jgi:hypothetical protein